MLQKKELRALAYFVLFAVVFLGLIYHRVNPGMERYITHLIPFLLIPASYGLIESKENLSSFWLVQNLIRFYGKRSWMRSFLTYQDDVILIPIVILIILQGLISYRGLHLSQDPSWFRVSYEEKAAEMVRQHLSKCHSRAGGNPENHLIPDPSNSAGRQVGDDKICLLIVSLPEPYFYHLHTSIQSIADDPPFIYIDNVKDTQKIMIVEDMGMHEYFPHFTKFLQSNLKGFEKSHFFVHENFHISDKIVKEKYPVIMYELTLGELKTKIKNSNP